MVARTPQKQRKVAMVVAPPLNSELLRETINKVDKCMERLQELQYTIAGGNKVVSGVNLSPRSTRTYLKTSLRCKQETLRIKNATNKKSPIGKFPASSPGDWRKMSLPAMLLGETVNEILQASQVTRDIVDALAPKKCRKSRRLTMPEEEEEEEEDDPKTPETHQKSREQNPETVSSNIKARRKKEKQNKRSEPTSPRARSRIVFKIVSPHKTAEKVQHLANRVSPKHRPWVKKAVLFPNPLFISGSSTQQAKFSRTMSPVIARSSDLTSSKNTKKETPHKFLIKSPSKSPTKFQVRIKSPPKVSVSPNRNGSNLGRKSPTRSASLGKKSPPKLSAAGKLRRSFTPTRNGNNVARKSSISPKRVTLQAFISPARNGDLGKKSPKASISPNKKTQKLSTAAKLRRSFSPSRLAMRLVSPMKSRKSVGRCDDGGMGGMMVSGLRQRPVIVPKRFSMGRIS
ncbi:putative microtubule-binding protein TANGLED [Raphanus sativus]|uniref:Microtubule-binding protein TANGLED n=1 Tax=Raphanus sativus TaxID=3726 RepID=A0A6J0NQS9_RAPSA|nr:microtubule-binding protein TANGLED [Raphanus sativus]KAJ4892933.1 putative microtubule-binding protein TANGLED [Raphanus sativus]